MSTLPISNKPKRGRTTPTPGGPGKKPKGPVGTIGGSKGGAPIGKPTMGKPLPGSPLAQKPGAGKKPMPGPKKPR